jgi:hypothetical protein
MKMNKSLKASLIAIFVVLVNFLINFLIFTYSYNKLATPYLNEEQRVENVGYIMTGTLGMYLLSAVLVGVVFFINIK